MPTISVIVPVYKVEPYLRRCVDSILQQTYTDFELILVDDGSPDGCPALCDEYAAQDNRVKVVHKPNGGVSSARNAGLDIAQGEYIGFVDGDDWIEPNMYELLIQYGTETGADILYCEAQFIYERDSFRKDDIPLIQDNRVIKKADWSPELLKMVAGSACHAAYKRDLICEKSVRFPQGLAFSEDRVFNLQMMGNGNFIAFLKRGLYDIRIHDESCTHSFHPDHFEMARRAAEETQRAIREAWNDDPAYQDAFLSQYVDAVFAGFHNLNHPKCHISLKEKYRIIREECNQTLLQEALVRSGYTGTMSQLVKERRYLSVLLWERYYCRVVICLLQSLRNRGLSGTVKRLAEKRKGRSK